MTELKRLGSRISLSPTIWLLTLEMGRIHGWTPAGTRQTQADGASVDILESVRHLMGWQMEYLANDGLTVSATDAANLADALARASSHGDRIMLDWTQGRSVPPADVRTDSSGFRWFGTHEGKNHLQTVAKFCRGGAFQIL